MDPTMTILSSAWITKSEATKSGPLGTIAGMFDPKHCSNLPSLVKRAPEAYLRP